MRQPRLIATGTHLLIAAALVGATAVHGARQTSDDARLADLYDRDAWFELRDAIAGKDVAPLYAGAVASAFNRVDEAEKHLTRAVREATTTEAANEARGKLSILYIRIGRLSDAGRIIDEILKTEPGRADVANARAVFGAYADRPNQIVERSRRGTFRCGIWDDGVRLPVEIGRGTPSWLLDTGANVSVISEGEAKWLGLKENDAARIGDLAGGSAGARTTVAPRLRIGNTELRNVPMLILPDDRPPFDSMASGERGLLGLPVALALQSIRWTKPSSCETSLDAPPAPTMSNLAFNSLFPIVRGDVAGRQAAFVLDTGNQAGTQLWERFQRDFTALVSERGKKGTVRVTQFGGSNDREVMVLPELALRIGGFDALLKPANVFSRPVGDDRWHGNLGMDVLSQAEQVIIDFRSMSVTLKPAR